MIVTDLKYSIDDKKLGWLNFLIERVTGKKKFQNVIITDGKEGEGKSTLTAGDAYYIAYTTRRPLRLFFDIDAMNDFVLLPTTKDHIIIWDDAALAGLTLEAYSQAIIKLIKILLLARKKRNTYFINIQEVFRLKEPLVSRAIGMNHVYSPDGIKLGKYTWMKEKKLMYLYEVYKTKKKKLYRGVWNGRATFSNVLYKVFDEEQYETLKDKAILSIQTNTKGDQNKIERLERYRYALASLGDWTDEERVEKLRKLIGEVTIAMLKTWRLRYKPSNAKEHPAPLVVASRLTNDKESYIRPKDEGYLSRPIDNSPLTMLPKVKKHTIRYD